MVKNILSNIVNTSHLNIHCLQDWKLFFLEIKILPIQLKKAFSAAILKKKIAFYIKEAL